MTILIAFQCVVRITNKCEFRRVDYMQFLVFLNKNENNNKKCLNFNKNEKFLKKKSRRRRKNVKES